jgi:type I restriction enzyme M protein
MQELPDFLEFFQINEALKLTEAIKDGKVAAKAARVALDELVVKHYPKLSLDEAKALVIDDKWLATIAAAVESELDRVAQRLSGRAGQLAERYDRNLADLMKRADDAQARVAAHLAKMGFAL